jgi:hypothetical protein
MQRDHYRHRPHPPQGRNTPHDHRHNRYPARSLIQVLFRSDAQVLLAHVLATDRVWLVAHAGDPHPRTEAAFFALAKRRRTASRSPT